MKVKFGAIIVDGSGKIGGHFVSKNKGSVSLRTSNHKKHQATELQQLRRYAYSALSIQWRALSSADKDYYVRSAPKGLTGFNYYISIFINQFKLTNMLTATVKISAADVIGKTTIPIIPACGAGKMINLFGVSAILVPGSIAFTGDPIAIGMVFNNYSGYGGGPGFDPDLTNPTICSNLVPSSNYQPVKSGSAINNGSLSIKQFNSVTNGNGYAILSVSYSIEDYI